MSLNSHIRVHIAKKFKCTILSITFPKFIEIMSDPPLYDSLDETVTAAVTAKCVFCKKITDDRVLFGDKYTIKGKTFHNFCLVRNFAFFLLKLLNSFIDILLLFDMSFHVKFVVEFMDNLSFFQLFASGLQQKLNDNEEILGYLKTDIDAELKRASKLVRMLCYSKHVY